jgi:hypothetical protein
VGEPDPARPRAEQLAAGFLPMLSEFLAVRAERALAS